MAQVSSPSCDLGACTRILPPLVGTSGECKSLWCRLFGQWKTLDDVRKIHATSVSGITDFERHTLFKKYVPTFFLGIINWTDLSLSSLHMRCLISFRFYRILDLFFPSVFCVKLSYSIDVLVSNRCRERPKQPVTAVLISCCSTLWFPLLILTWSSGSYAQPPRWIASSALYSYVHEQKIAGQKRQCILWWSYFNALHYAALPPSILSNWSYW